MEPHNNQNGKEISFDSQLENEFALAGESFVPPADTDGRVGVTMFDTLGSEDNLVSVVVPKDKLKDLPAQALVKIDSAKDGDGRIYQGIVVKGPLYEPDGIKADSAVIVTTASNGVMFMPKYHGRVWVEILGELIDGTLIPPRYSPLPNSPVFPLSPEESKAVLNLDGDITLGRAIGHEDREVKIPSNRKSVLPRHIGILGTTGGGKSTTVSGLVHHFQKSGIATILIDTEGEYTHINQPTEKQNMLNALECRGLKPEGVENTRIMKLVDDETTNPEHPNVREFTLYFDQLSPYTIMEILDFTDAQQQRFLKAYDIARVILKKLKIFPVTEDDTKLLYDLDEFERGYYKTTLALVYDIVAACGKKAAKEGLADENKQLLFPSKWLYKRSNEDKEQFLKCINEADFKNDSVASWRAIQGHLSLLLRLKIFDNPEATSFDFDELTSSGQVSIIDLSDTKGPKIRNLVIAELLKGLMEKQDQHHSSVGEDINHESRVMVIIEEAHEFLSAQRIKQMPTLYDQVARIAKRGRKRWLGMAFVTQLPQHLPDEVLALLNNFVLHKISDANVVSRLKRTVGSIDEGLWDKLKNLSSGQAVVSFSHMRRGMLVAIDPTPCKLLMVD